MNTFKLGSAKINQVSIDENIKQKDLEEYLIQNISVFEDYLEKNKINDDITNKFLHHLKEKKGLLFKINKHIEIYTKFNKSDIIKVFGYLIFRYKFLIAGKEKKNLGYPPYLLIELVSTCNLRCPFCFQTDKSFTKKPFMGVIDFDFFKKVVDEADDLGIGAVTMGSRGEPTLHKQLGEMLEYISNKKNIYEVKLNTNATFLNEKVCEIILKNNINQMVISADHYEKETYEKLRKNSNFEKILKNIDTLYKMRSEQYPNSITEIRVSGVDFEKKLDKKKFKDFWIKRSDHVSAGDPLERWDTYNNDVHLDINDPCEQLWDRMYVWFDGKVNPCDADYKSKLSFGNLKNSSIKDVWNNKQIELLRESHICGSRSNYDPCNKCGATFV
tara:strand:+ start:381 stop:1538 length:1158 start_codon:yes stop_codon:yes gene_type:complete